VAELADALDSKSLDLWKDADPGIPEVRTLIEDARKRLAGLKELH